MVSEAGGVWNVGREQSKMWGLATVYNTVSSLEERFDAPECWILPRAADEETATNSTCSLHLRQGREMSVLLCPGVLCSGQ